MDNSVDDKQIEEQTAQYLWDIGRKVSSSCPAASRYYIFSLKRSIDNLSVNTKGIKEHLFCKHCGSLWSSQNHRVRIKPPVKKNNHIKKLLKWETEQPWILNNRQRKKLSKYRESSNKIVYTCSCCKKTTEQPGFKRKVLTTEKMTSLYQLPSKIKPKKRDLNAGLLIHSTSKEKLQQKTVLDSEKFKSKESLSKSYKETSSQQSFLMNKLSLSQNVNSSSNLPKSKRKKSLLAQILKQEQEAGKKKSGLSSFLISI